MRIGVGGGIWTKMRCAISLTSIIRLFVTSLFSLFHIFPFLQHVLKQNLAIRFCAPSRWPLWHRPAQSKQQFYAIFMRS